MGVFYETIPNSQRDWILDQKLFWVATAPLSGEGHINVSPKGGQYFGIIDARTFWFMDLTGSGIETISHLHEPGNGRICVLFNAFEGPPKIIRLWGTGTVLENGTKEYAGFVEEHGVKTIPGARSIIVVDVHQCGSSCGFSVPFFDFKAFRTTLNDFFEKKARKEAEGKDEGMDKYWAYKSQLSIDGLPGMKRGYEFARKNKVEPLKKMVGKYAPKYPRTVPKTISINYVMLIAVLSFLLGVAVVFLVETPAAQQLVERSKPALLNVTEVFNRQIRSAEL